MVNIRFFKNDRTDSGKYSFTRFGLFKNILFRYWLYRFFFFLTIILCEYIGVLIYGQQQKFEQEKLHLIFVAECKTSDSICRENPNCLALFAQAKGKIQGIHLQINIKGFPQNAGRVTCIWRNSMRPFCYQGSAGCGLGNHGQGQLRFLCLYC